MGKKSSIRLRGVECLVGKYRGDCIIRKTRIPRYEPYHAFGIGLAIILMSYMITLSFQLAAKKFK